MRINHHKKSTSEPRSSGSSIRYRLLEAGEVDGQGALVHPGAEGRHRDIGDGRDHHERREVVQEYRHQEMADHRRPGSHPRSESRGSI